MTASLHLSRSRRLIARARGDIAKAARALGLSLTLAGCSTEHKSPMPAPSIAAEPSTPPPSIEEANARAIAIKDEALTRCHTSGGIPAMGFGFTVICLKPQSVSWTREPHFPPFESGVK